MWLLLLQFLKSTHIIAQAEIRTQYLLDSICVCFNTCNKHLTEKEDILFTTYNFYLLVIVQFLICNFSIITSEDRESYPFVNMSTRTNVNTNSYKHYTHLLNKSPYNSMYTLFQKNIFLKYDEFEKSIPVVFFLQKMNIQSLRSWVILIPCP